jgi:hypothetical protein
MAKRQRDKWAASHPNERRDINARRRARMRGAATEMFTRVEILQRDRGRCHLCRRKVKRKWHLGVSQLRLIG